MSLLVRRYVRGPALLTLDPVHFGRDLDFLRQLYASTRTEELMQVDWSEQQKADFLSFQFDAQHRHYQQHYPEANRDLLCLDGEPIGRLYLDQREQELRIIDIALLPEYRGQGHGSAVLRDILNAAARLSLAVTIHVECNNPALTLYRRMGFLEIEQRGLYLLMRWAADT